MNESLFNNLSLEEKAEIVLKTGTFIRAEDNYSYRIQYYAFGDHIAELLFDFTDRIVSVEFVEKKIDENPSPDPLTGDTNNPIVLSLALKSVREAFRNFKSLLAYPMGA